MQELKAGNMNDRDKVHGQILDIMRRIERPAQGYLPFPFLSVSCGEHYADSVYCWDNHHMGLRFAWAGKPDYLRHMIDNLLHHQTGNGFTPNVVNARLGPSHVRPPFHCQPHLMQGALVYADQSGDTAWAAQVYSKLESYLRYYEENWQAPYGLFRWPLAYMSGFDNDVVTTFFAPDTIIPCDVNAWITMEYRAASVLAGRLGLSETAARYRVKADALASAINEVLWNESVDSYCAFNLSAGRHQFALGDKFVTSVGRFAFQSCSNLIPLYARIAPAERAERMIRKYVLSPEHFLSLFGIRSLSKSSEYYNNGIWGNPPRYGAHDRLTNSNWQGPVWIPLNYFMAHALAHYGFQRDAEDLADRTARVLALSLDTVGSFAENFDGDTGAPLYARDFASWNILADILHDELGQGRWLLDPVFA
jgi:neutral trehalase